MQKGLSMEQFARNYMKVHNELQEIVKKKHQTKEKTNFEFLVNSLKNQGYEVEAEFKFCHTRKFRADFMVAKNNKKVLIEYEGIFASKSRHSSKTGYTNDCTKYNIAQLNGYAVFRYTAMNFEDVVKDINNFFN